MQPDPAEVTAGKPFLDVAMRQVTPEVKPETPFERWMIRLASRQLHEEIVQQEDLMYWFSNLLEGKKSSPPVYALEEIPQYYFKNELPAIQTAMATQLSASFGKRLGARLATQLDPQQYRTGDRSKHL